MTEPKHYRDAATGRYTSAEDAAERPGETVAETMLGLTAAARTYRGRAERLEAAVADYRDRLVLAAFQLNNGTAEDSPEERQRRQHKAEGVRLALDYLRAVPLPESGT